VIAAVRLRRAPRRPPRFVPAIVTVVLTALALAGCAKSGSEGSRSAIAREGTRGAHRFRVSSVLDPARVTLGQPSSWSLRAELPQGARPGELLRDPGPAALDVAEQGEPGGHIQEGKVVWSGRFRVRGFDLGPVPLPRAALVVQFPGRKDTLEFPIDTLDVDSLTAASSGSLEPDRGAIKPELRPIDIALAAALALVVIAAVVALVLAIRRRRRAAKGLGEEAPPEPPEAPFLRAIEALRGEIETLPRDRFYDRLSLAIRAYAGAVTGLPALDLTTSELTRELARRGDVRSDAATLVERELRRSDLAKFARYEDPAAEAREALDHAASLAGRLAEPPPAPPPPAPPPPAAAVTPPSEAPPPEPADRAGG
jgi:hypothetical protein